MVRFIRELFIYFYETVTVNKLIIHDNLLKSHPFIMLKFFSVSGGLAAPQGATVFIPLDNTQETSSLTSQLANPFVRYIELIHSSVPAYDRLTTWGMVAETAEASGRRRRSSAIEHLYTRPHVPGPPC